MTSKSAKTAPIEKSQHEIDCGIVIITYNSERHIERLLDSLPSAAGELRTRCIVVDNNSYDNTVPVVRSRGDAEVIEAGGNLGYSGGINLGRAAVGPCSSFLILNPDLTLEPNAIIYLFQALNDPTVGMAVPMLVNNDSTLYYSLRREPSLIAALGDALFGAHWPRRPNWLSDTIRRDEAYRRSIDVAWAGGAAMLISAACSDTVGDWDADRFFLYSEETDFAARARRLGFRIRYIPAARARHEDGGSGRSPILYTLMVVNKIRYYEKHHGRVASTILRVIVTLQHLLRVSNPDMRHTLKVVLQRSLWSQLPHGDTQNSTRMVAR